MALDLGTLALYLTVNDTGLNSGLASAEQKTGRVADALTGLAKRGAIAFGLVTTAAGFLGVKTAAANEQAMIAFETMLGSAEKAAVFLKDLQSFAASTPFEFPELQSAASALISAGIEADKVIPIMTTLGDVTSGMGTGSEGVKRATIALQQMSAAGRITGEDLNQLRDAGIPVYDLLAEATGKSKEKVVELAQAGKLGKKELGQMMAALESGKGLERFGGLMEKQSASLGGMWSTMLDTIGQGTAKVIEPLMPLMKQGLGGSAVFLAGTFAVLAGGAEHLSTAILFSADAIDAMTRFVDSNQTTFKILAGIIGTLLIPLIVALGVKTTIATAQMVVGWAAAATGAVASASMNVLSLTLMGAAWIAAGVQATASAIRMAAAWVIAMGPIGIAVAAIAGAVYLVIKHWDTIKEKTGEAWGWVVAQVKKVPGLIVGFFLNFTLPGLIIKHWSTIKSTFSDGVASVVAYMRALPGKILRAVGNLGSLLGNVGEDIMSGLVSGIDRGFDWVRDKLGGVGKLIPGWLKKVLGISSPSKVMRDQVGQWIPAGIAEGIEDGIPQISSALDKVARSTTVALPKTSMRATSGAESSEAFGPTGPWVASLVGARVEMGEDGFMTFVDGRVELGLETAQRRTAGTRQTAGVRR